MGFRMSFQMRFRMAFGTLAKSTEESLFVVHENGVPYITKWPPVRYCQIAIFQGFGMAIPRSESGPENSRRDGGENGAGDTLVAMNQCRSPSRFCGYARAFRCSRRTGKRYRSPGW